MKTKEENNYIKPLLTVCDLSASQSFMVTSPGGSIGTSNEEAGGDEEVLGNERRGTWGDLWGE